MEFKQLRSFVTVVDCGSFTQASKELYISQPSISTHIRQLESELNSRLIIRTTKRLEVTPRGKELYETAKAMLGLWDNMIHHWHQDKTPILQVAATTLPATYLLPEILPSYGKVHPNVYFVLHQDTPEQIVSGIITGSYSVGLIGQHIHSDHILCETILKDPCVFITPVTNHYLSLLQDSSFDSLALLNEPLIYREEAGKEKKNMTILLEQLHKKEADLNIVARVNDQETVKNLVANGLGVSLISKKAALDFYKEKRLLIFPIPDNTIYREICVVYHKEYVLSAQIKDFIHFLKNFYTEVK